MFIALTTYGWQRNNENKLEIVWDTPENIAKVQSTLEHVLHGCKCKTGCNTRRCKCKKAAKECGPGCQCTGCSNTPASSPPINEDLQILEIDDRLDRESDDASTEASDDDSDNIDNDIDQIFEEVFGGSNSSSESDSELVP